MILDMIFSTVAALAIVIVGGIAIGVLTEESKEGWATTVFVALMLYLGFKVDWDVSFLLADAPVYIGAFFVYVLVGVAWAAFKWWSFLGDSVSEFKRKYEDFKVDPAKYIGTLELADLKELYGTIENIPIEQKWFRHLQKFYGRMNISNTATVGEIAAAVAPKAAEHKAQIVAWIAYFPVSMLWTLINNPVRRFILWVYEAVSGIFQQLSERAFKSAIDVDGLKIQQANEKIKKINECDHLSTRVELDGHYCTNCGTMTQSND